MDKINTSQAERMLLMLTHTRLWRSGVEARKLATELGVSVRQLRRDRILLARFGFQLGVEAGDDGVHRLRFVRESAEGPLPSDAPQ